MVIEKQSKEKEIHIHSSEDSHRYIKTHREMDHHKREISHEGDDAETSDACGGRETEKPPDPGDKILLEGEGSPTDKDEAKEDVDVELKSDQG